MASATQTYTPDKDSLLKAASLVNIVDNIDQIDRRDRQSQMQEVGLYIQAAGLELDKQRADLAVQQQQMAVSKDLSKTNAAKSLADFSSAFDPTDLDHKAKANWYRSWAIGEGMEAQEVQMAFKDVDLKTTATSALLESYRTFGVTDWEKTPDGKRIDVQATEFKARQNAEEMEISKKTWGTRDKELHRVISSARDDAGKPLYNLSDSVALVNANREILNDYLDVSGKGLWSAPANFAEQFAMPANSKDKGIAQQNDSLGYGKPAIYNRDALELNQGFIKARSIARRMDAGEVPTFKTDEAGNTMYDTNGTALVTGWTRSKEDSAVIKAGEDAVKARADAVIANQEAINKTALGSIGARADAAAKLTNASFNASDPGTKAGIDADMAALYNNGGAPANPKRAEKTKADGF